MAKAKSCSGSTANLEEDHSNESNANLFALGNIIFRSVCKRTARGSNVGFRHFGKGWPLAGPRTGNVLSPAAVLIEDGKIKEVGAPSQVQPHAPAGAKTIDLGTATLLPGLIDSHTHLLVDPVLPAEAERARHYNGSFVPGLLLAIVESPSKRVLLGAQMAREDLESGITTVRNLGTRELTGMLRCGMR